jgi:hypothetical protein
MNNRPRKTFSQKTPPPRKISENKSNSGVKLEPEQPVAEDSPDRMLSQETGNLKKLTPADILALQRTVGNQAVLRILAERKKQTAIPSPSKAIAAGKTGTIQRVYFDTRGGISQFQRDYPNYLDVMGLGNLKKAQLRALLSDLEKKLTGTSGETTVKGIEKFISQLTVQEHKTFLETVCREYRTHILGQTVPGGSTPPPTPTTPTLTTPTPTTPGVSTPPTTPIVPSSPPTSPTVSTPPTTPGVSTPPTPPTLTTPGVTPPTTPTTTTPVTSTPTTTTPVTSTPTTTTPVTTPPPVPLSPDPELNTEDQGSQDYLATGTRLVPEAQNFGAPSSISTTTNEWSVKILSSGTDNYYRINGGIKLYVLPGGSYYRINGGIKLWIVPTGGLPAKYPASGRHYPVSQAQDLDATKIQLEQKTLVDATEVAVFKYGDDKVLAKKEEVSGPSTLPGQYPPTPPVSTSSYSINQAEEIAATGVNPTDERLPDGTGVVIFKYQSKQVLAKKEQLSGQLTAAYTVIEVDTTSGKEKYKVDPTKTGTRTAGHKAIEGGIFGEDGPKEEDIRQTNLGDCYLQAVLISIAKSNPAHLQNMIKDNNDGTVTIRFYHGTPPSTAANIRINKTVATGKTGKALYNAGENWARLLEKAFVVFAAQYGQYGYIDALRTVRQGYKNIESGIEYKLYGVFYGPAAVSANRLGMNYNHNSSASDTSGNVEAIKKLFQFKDGARYLDPGQAMNLTVGATLLEHLKRLKDVNPSDLISVLRSARFTSAATKLANLTQTLIEEAIVEQGDDSLTSKPQVRTVITLAKAAVEDTATGSLTSAVSANSSHRDISALFELLSDIKEAGTDSSQGKRFIYSAHAYTITGVELKNTLGVVLTPTKTEVDSGTVAGQVDATQSTVTLRNPHHTNAPTENTKSSSQEQGTFTISLTQFFRNFNALDYGLVRKTVS